MIATIIDFILHIDQHLVALTAQYGAWLYAILFWIVFCETGLVVTPFLPGDSLLFAAGAVAAASQGNLNVHAVVGVLLIAAILGDAVNFAIGKYFGAKLFANPNSKIFKQEYLHKTHAFYEKYGGKTIILARFVPIVRTFAPFVAGMGDMNYSKFIRYNIIGALAWVLSLTYLGYLFGNLPMVKDNFGKVVIGIIVVSVLPMVFEMIKAKMGKQNDTK
ncbi:DedA family protein [Kingella kingae]|uniref:DedA family membrane protein n=3 Tax=Kingella kingae TaxID=504 RepID=F5S8Q8_KINKI|nr:DedA family protein [Kingella kingae]EGK07884.1 DedA family membrane protein [Kingella kingae ATCC 23330]MBD3613738.1 DedA family protein [Kingella kingae]MBD3631923.1 DedA family protein [Kingella kingae]MBD3659369.1 DedA family protein [Kingella kingae]MDK4527564.1 DedA family protein [Kingella kingae]